MKKIKNVLVSGQANIFHFINKIHAHVWFVFTLSPLVDVKNMHIFQCSVIACWVLSLNTNFDSFPVEKLA